MTQKTPHVLILDDDPDFLEVHQHLLEREGCRVACFSEPDAAFNAAIAEKPDLVITDLMMASLTSGFSFAQRLRQDPRFEGLPIILVTAVGSQRGFDFSPKTRDDLEAMRVDAFFEKPVNPKQLVARVRELLSRNTGTEPQP